MALLVHPPPVDGPRRSSRIRVRRQTSHARSSCLLTHTHSAVSPHIVPRSLSRDPTAPSVKDIRSSPAAPKSGFHPSTSQRKRAPHNARTRASSTTNSSSRTKSHSKKSPPPVSEPSVLAGRKRKRSPAADEPAYELVSAHEPAGSDEEAQTPRQLRYAKRQRLLVSRSGNLATSPPGPSIRKGERVLQRASTEGRLLSPQSPANTAYTEPETCNICKDIIVPDTPCPQDRVRVERPPTPRPPFEAASKCDAPSLAPDSDPPAPVVDIEDRSPTITPLRRLSLPPRDRRPDMTDQGMWKIACQERVEYLKDVYREVFEAVLRAEALTAQRSSEAPSHIATTADAPSPAEQAEFKLYTPSTCTQARTDADGDSDMDVGYSSDWDSDEDEDDDEDDDLLMDTDGTLPTYDAVIALDGQEPTATKLPRLASIRVYALEAVPEQNARNGVPFMGRGTPVDRQRRADWASPPRPCFSSFSHQPWTPSAQFFAPSPQIAFSAPMQVDAGVYQMSVSAHSPYGASPMQVDEPYVPVEPPCMPWLDPALRAESASPSPSPVPSVIVPPSLPSFAPPPYSSVPLSSAVVHDIPSVSVELLSSSISSSSSSSAASDASAPTTGSPSPTGCAWHATFLQCLQSPGCAPFFASEPALAPAPALAPTPMYAAPPVPTDPVSGPALSPVQDSTPFVGQAPVSPPPQLPPYAQNADATGMGVGVGGVGVGEGTAMGMFPNQELAQFVRSHLVPGSVTLSHALG
ncbi:hypothetical protein C8Q80DRAFT_1269970 [Daedaleopsis nitida]|nr:hypothetical protein C8Q80DRAFT_1269970 [Daedaleopsis nitida]